MKPNENFLYQPGNFWAYVRTISEHVGYSITKRGPNRGKIKVPSILEMKDALEDRLLEVGEIVTKNNEPTSLGVLLHEYYAYRASVLNSFVEPRLMDAARAKEIFEKLYKELSSTCPIPMNKQKGDKKTPAYLTGIVNMLIEANADGIPCDYDPQQLTTITKDGYPLRTLARRVDGAFPSVINPIAVWETKEYYYTTTFGSRVADGVYETLLDGMELRELFERENIKVYHYMIVDAHYTWWVKGRSYLCRVIDMLHMGYVDEVLFGYEVVERMPQIVKEWVETYKQTDFS